MTPYLEPPTCDVVRGVRHSAVFSTDRVPPVMAGDLPPQPAGSSGPPPGAGQGWTALAYLLAGMAMWGFVGWLVDQWLNLGGIATGIGVVLGMAGGIYLVVRRLGTPD